MLPELKIEDSWHTVINTELDKSYISDLDDFLETEQKAGKTTFPTKAEIFNAFNHAPFDKVKVVILGQDPYHGVGQAHGLSFSVPEGVKIPPSLKNIYKELHSDLGLDIPSHGNLTHWADQGVLLLNSVLTVEQAIAASHKKQGWETFTDAIIQSLNDQREGLVFILWGSYAQKKAAFVDRGKHLVLEGVHPSPLSAYGGFFGCKHFSKTNDYLKKMGKEEIDWAIPDPTRLF